MGHSGGKFVDLSHRLAFGESFGAWTRGRSSIAAWGPMDVLFRRVFRMLLTVSLGRLKVMSWRPALHVTGDSYDDSSRSGVTVAPACNQLQFTCGLDTKTGFLETRNTRLTCCLCNRRIWMPSAKQVSHLCLSSCIANSRWVKFYHYNFSFTFLITSYPRFQICVRNHLRHHCHTDIPNSCAFFWQHFSSSFHNHVRTMSHNHAIVIATVMSFPCHENAVVLPASHRHHVIFMSSPCVHWDTYIHTQTHHASVMLVQFS